MSMHRINRNVYICENNMHMWTHKSTITKSLKLATTKIFIRNKKLWEDGIMKLLEKLQKLVESNDEYIGQ